MSKVCWIIAGATSSIAAQFALIAAERGDQIILLARDAQKMAAIAETVMMLAQHPINLLVAFGVMSENKVEAAQVNFTAVVSVCDVFVPYFQAQNRGSITIIGSVSGDRARAKHFTYSAAKAALVPFCEGLQLTLKKYHVFVTLMKPGYINTPMTFGAVPEQFSASPLSCAKACLKASDRQVAVQYFPRIWRLIMFVFRCLPKFMITKIS